MIRKPFFYFLLVTSLVGLNACSGDDNSTGTSEDSHLTSFKNEREFADFLSTYQAELSADGAGEDAIYSSVQEDQFALSDDSESSITNNQENGVDEGDIVKAFNDYLIILRRGKLISINAGQDLNTSDIVDSYAPDSTLGTWYDELIISDNNIVVLGYSYHVGATEIGLFSIDENGIFQYRDTYFLRSHDYYSSRNYASRLIGNELVFYMPYFLQYDGYEQYLPAMLNISDIDQQNASYESIRNHNDWQRIIQSYDIYLPATDIEYPALHTIVRCDLNTAELACSAKGILAPYSRSFYVSQDAVYLWTNEYTSSSYQDDDSRPATSVVYRLPWSDDNISVLGSYGSPIDQFSFKDDGSYLHMLLRPYSGGDWMWNPEYTEGDLSYAKIPLGDFSDTLETVDDSRYMPLNNPGYAIANRFIDNYLVYGSSSAANIYLLNTETPEALETIATTSNVNRIDRLGSGAIVVGTEFEEFSNSLGDVSLRSNNNLVMNTLSLGDIPSLNDSFVIENAYEGEQRSHGYNTTETDHGSVFGLPIVRYVTTQDSDIEDPDASTSFWGGWFPSSAEVIYMRANDNLILESLGSLYSEDDQWSSSCNVSCVDWYGNARPIFFQDKIFALLGYEIIEGEINQSQILEVDRVNFTPDL